jgi:hypothetical protein
MSRLSRYNEFRKKIIADNNQRNDAQLALLLEKKHCLTGPWSRPIMMGIALEMNEGARSALDSFNQRCHDRLRSPAQTMRPIAAGAS